MRCRHNVYYSANEETRISVQAVSRSPDEKCYGGYHTETVLEDLSEVNVNGSTWKRASYGGNVSLRNTLLSKEANTRVSFDDLQDGSWFWLDLPPFELSRTAAVRLEFNGISSGHKRGLEWDLLQLNKID